MKFIKMCKYCGHYFETNSSQKIYCNLQHYRPCPICGKATAMIDNDFSRPQKCCSSECTQKLRMLNSNHKKCVLCGELFAPRSGCQIICDKLHYRNCEICNKRFVIDSKSYKTITTCSDRCSKIKLQNKYMEKYDVKHPMQNKDVQNRFYKSMKEKYGVKHALQSKEFLEKARTTNIYKYNVEYYCITKQCRDAGNNVVSSNNLKFRELLKSKGIETSIEFPIKNRGFDLRILNTNILIEINPSYTHSILPNHYGNGKDKYYHRDKTQLAEDNGFRCIHVWDWDDKQKIVEYLKPREILDANEFDVYKLTTSSANKFLNKYHILGSHRGQVLCLGLVKDDEIYQIMTFCKSRYNKNYYAQLCRWCTLPGYEISGGYDKLSSYASEQFGVTNVIAYVDRSKFDGSELESIGMKLDHITPPRLIWTKEGEYINSSLVISGKSKYHSYDELIEDGYVPMYDCGQRVYVC